MLNHLFHINVMKMKLLAAFTAVLLSSIIMNAEEKQFSAPATTGGMPINEVVAKRHSSVTFDKSRPVDQKTLGQLLWMTLGVNRPDAPVGKLGKANRTNPTAINAQEVTAYVFDTDGVWEYIASDNKLVKRADGDHRDLLAGTPQFRQDFVLDAPISVLLVTDTEKFAGMGPRAIEAAMIDAGIANQNLNLAAESLGLATRPRMTMDIEAIRTLLKLKDTQIPALNNPIGY